MGWAPQSNQFCINSLITCNICDHGGIYKKHRPRVFRVRRNFSVKTDRCAAAVVAIDPLRRKMSGATETKRQNMTMSDNFDLHNPFKPVDSMHGDAIGDDGPVEHETAILARDQDGGHLGRPLTPTSSKTGKHATKSPFGPHYGDSYWTPERKREAAGDEDPTREHVNARKKGKSAPDASPGLQTPRKHDTTSKQSDRDGSPPPTPAEAEVEFDGRASSDDEDARKDDAIDPIVDLTGDDTDVEDSREVDHQYSESTDDPFLRDHMVFAEYEHAWYAGSISALHPPGGDDGDFVYDVHTYADGTIEKVSESSLKHFMHEGFEDMVAHVKNSNCVEACLCLYYAAMDFNCRNRHEDWIDMQYFGLGCKQLKIPDDMLERIETLGWCKDLRAAQSPLEHANAQP